MKRNDNNQRGFTLIELMIVISIIGILVVIAYPGYTTYVQRANQSAAQSFMVTASSQFEQYRLDAREYPETFADANITVPTDLITLYDFVPSATNTATPPSFSITATPIAGSTQAGRPELVLHNSGNKTPIGEWQ